MKHDPFPDRLLRHHYPTIDDTAIPRPKLSPDLENYFYGEHDKTNLNSLPWYTEMCIRELLPLEEQLSYALKVKKKAAVADCSGSNGGPTELLPDLMHTFLVDMIMDCGRLELHHAAVPSFRRCVGDDDGQRQQRQRDPDDLG